MGKRKYSNVEIKKLVNENGYELIEAYRKALKNGYTTQMIKFRNKSGIEFDVNFSTFKRNLSTYNKNENKTYKCINEYTLKDNVSTLKITNKNNEVFNVLFTTSKYDLIKNIKWWITNEGYVYGYKDGKSVPFHRIIMDCPLDKVVDHINRNKLDNTDKNLRIVTHSENCRNRYDNYWKWGNQ